MLFLNINGIIEQEQTISKLIFPAE